MFATSSSRLLQQHAMLYTADWVCAVLQELVRERVQGQSGGGSYNWHTAFCKMVVMSVIRLVTLLWTLNSLLASHIAPKVRTKFKGESWAECCSRQPFCKTLYTCTPAPPLFSWGWSHDPEACRQLAIHQLHQFNGWLMHLNSWIGKYNLGKTQVWHWHTSNYHSC